MTAKALNIFWYRWLNHLQLKMCKTSISRWFLNLQTKSRPHCLILFHRRFKDHQHKFWLRLLVQLDSDFMATIKMSFRFGPKKNLKSAHKRVNSYACICQQRYHWLNLSIGLLPGSRILYQLIIRILWQAILYYHQKYWASKSIQCIGGMVTFSLLIPVQYIFPWFPWFLFNIFSPNVLTNVFLLDLKRIYDLYFMHFPMKFASILLDSVT